MSKTAQLEAKANTLADELALEERAHLQLWDDYCRVQRSLKTVTIYASRTAAERNRLREENKKLRAEIDQLEHRCDQLALMFGYK